MDVGFLELGRDVEQKLLNIALHVELKEHKRLRPLKNLNELVDLLKIAERSSFDEIKISYSELLLLLNQRQLNKLKIHGFTASIPEKNSHVDSAQHSEQENTDNKNMHYRGATHRTEEGGKEPAGNREIHYRGAIQNKEEAEPEKKGKRRMIYRGKETWV